MINQCISQQLSVEGLASERYADLSLSELNKRGYRVIGGDKGDLRFDGYTLDADNNRTILYKPVLYTSLDLTDTEAYEIANEILQESFNSVGIETVEHS